MTYRRAMSNRLLLRADGGPGIGNGHVVRSLSLAEAWTARGGEAVLVSRVLSSELRRRAEAVGLSVALVGDETGGITAAVLDRDPAWVVFDGYRFGATHHRAARAAGARVAAIDDHARCGTYDIDLVVDQNLGVTEELYRTLVPARASVLAGSEYVLLGRRFVETAPPELRDPVGRVLVSLGGSPPARAVEVVRAAIAAAGLTARATFLVGGAPVADMPGLLRQIDLAIAAAGTTAWELCYFGVPMVLHPIVDNQDSVAAALGDAGAALVVRRDAGADEIQRAAAKLLDDFRLRVELSAAARRVVDGRGATRVVTQLRAALLQLRSATEADARLLYEWASDPSTRRWSFEPRPIEWEEHVRWLRRRLVDPDSAIFVVADEAGRPVGSFRATREGVRATVGVVVAPERRRQGWSAPLIVTASKRLLDDGWCEVLDAWIKAGNAASRQAFADARYVAVADTEDASALHYALSR